MKTRRELVLRGNYMNIFVAALMSSEWDHLEFMIKQSELSGILERWIEQGNVKEAGIILSEVPDPEGIREQLFRLTETGTHVTWFSNASSPSVKETAHGIDNVEFVLKNSIVDAVVKRYPSFKAKALKLDTWDPDLRAFGNYKIARARMENNPLLFKELFDVVLRSMETPFTISQLDSAEAQIVTRFRDEICTFLVGNSKQMKDLHSRVIKIAPTDLSVLILGETGTGKESVAGYLHEFSPRRGFPLVSINCAGLDEGFLRSELFGHLKGAYTGAVRERKGLIESAEGGTLFLDELHEMPLAVQTDLLRFLETRRFRPLGSDEEKEADIRIVAGALLNLLPMVEQGTFRLELFYRLANVQIRTPSLVEIPEDILLIVRYKLANMLGTVEQERILKSLLYFKKGVRILQKYTWPGNVRELMHYIKRRVYLGDDVLEELQEKMRNPSKETAGFPSFGNTHHSGTILPLETIRRGYVHHAYLHRGELSQQELAARLGISVNTLKRYLNNNHNAHEAALHE